MHSIISSNVLRQSLLNSGAPKPLCIRRPSSIVTSKDGTQLQQIQMVFVTGDILGYLRKNGNRTANDGAAIVAALQECFCADVVIVEAEHVFGKHEVLVKCILVVTARDSG